MIEIRLLVSVKEGVITDTIPTIKADKGLKLEVKKAYDERSAVVHGETKAKSQVKMPFDPMPKRALDVTLNVYG